MSPIRFGSVLYSLNQPEEIFAAARRAEELGFDSVWAGDHVSFHTPIHDCLTLLAACASVTRRIRLGSGVYLLALRHPTVAAKITATLDVLSGGRLIFGVGVGGENPKEFEACGVPHAERGARVTEGIEVVRALWRDTPASFHGRFTRFDGVSIDPKPVQQPGPPIWIGGRSDAALRRAALQGDGWVSYLIHAARFAQGLARIRAVAAEAGRALDAFTPAHLVFVSIGRDHESARATWIRLLSQRYAQDFTPLAERYGIIGTPAQCAEQLEAFVDAGCRHFLVNTLGDPAQQREHLEAVGAEILPRFQSRRGAP